MKEYLTAIRNYLIPFFGNHNIDCITPRMIAEFHVWRAERLGRELSASAQGTHNAALNKIFDEAMLRGYMAEIQRPALKNTGAQGDRRAEFSHDEIMELLRTHQTFIDLGRTDATRMLRELLTIYVPFMAATGICLLYTSPSPRD